MYTHTHTSHTAPHTLAQLSRCTAPPFPRFSLCTPPLLFVCFGFSLLFPLLSLVFSLFSPSSSGVRPILRVLFVATPYGRLLGGENVMVRSLSAYLTLPSPTLGQ